MRFPTRVCTLVMCLAMVPASAPGQKLTDRFEARMHEARPHGRLPFRLFKPDGSSKKRLPLVVFLHGVGRRGTDNRRQLRRGVREFVNDAGQKEHPCYVAAPQCPPDGWWAHDAQQELMLGMTRQLIATENIDRDRVYITGISMGGFGTWNAVARAPGLFAAAIPICGGGRPADAEALRTVPIWAFHGEKDRVVSPNRSRAMIDAIRRAGGNPRYTEYPEVGHNCWSRTYTNRRVHAWLFSHSRNGRTTRLLDGNRVVFFGDSITWAGARRGGYVKLMEATLAKVRPDLKVELIGAGISGNKVPDLQRRVEKDVIARKPHVVVIYIGINDVWHWGANRGTKKRHFEAGLKSLISRLEDSGARVLLCTPSVIGERKNGVNRFDPMLEDYSRVSRRVARDLDVHLLDLRRHFVEYLEEHNPADRERGILTTDGVHLNAAGNRFVAERMLEALGIQPLRSR